MRGIDIDAGAVGIVALARIRVKALATTTWKPPVAPAGSAGTCDVLGYRAWRMRKRHPWADDSVGLFTHHSAMRRYLSAAGAALLLVLVLSPLPPP